MTGLKHISYDEYAAIDAVRSSDLKAMSKSPASYVWAKAHPTDSDNLRLGRATHTLVLEPELFDTEFCEWTGGNRSGKAWTAYRDECEADGLTVLTSLQWDTAHGIRDAVMAHPVAGPMLRAPGVSEGTIVWTDAETGRACKVRPDRLAQIDARGTVIDLKKCQRCDAHGFARTVAEYDYHVQMAMYAAGIEAAFGGLPDVAIIAAEEKPPHEVAVHTLHGPIGPMDIPSAWDDDDIDPRRYDVLGPGSDEFHRRLRLLCECEESGIWPGCAPEALRLRLPPWAAGVRA